MGKRERHNRDLYPQRAEMAADPKRILLMRSGTTAIPQSEVHLSLLSSFIYYKIYLT